MKRLLPVVAFIFLFALGLCARPQSNTGSRGSVPQFQGARLVQVAHHRHAHHAGHHHHPRRRAHPRHA